MKKPRLTREMIARLPQERTVSSYQMGCDFDGRFALLKVRFVSTQVETLIIPPAIAHFVAKGMRSAWSELNLTDVRRRRDDPREEEPVIRRYLDEQPDFVDADWEGIKEPVPNVPIGVEVLADADALFLAWQLTDDIYRLDRMPWPIVPYYVEGIREFETAGKLLDLEELPAASRTRQ